MAQVQSLEYHGGDCVEVASLSTMIGVRDSKNPGAGHLTLSPERFAQLITAVKRESCTCNPRAPE